MPFPLTGSSLTASGVTKLIPAEMSEPVTRTAGSATSYARSATAVTAYGNQVFAQLFGLWQSNPPTGLFPRSAAGVSTAVGAVFLRIDATRSAGTATAFSRTADGVKNLLVLEIRRPNDTQARLKTRTDVSGVLHLSNEALNGGSINGSTTVTASRIGFRLAAAGQVNTSTTVMGSLVKRPANDNFANRTRIWTGLTENGSTEGASLESGDSGLGGVGSVWYTWYPPPAVSGVDYEYRYVTFQVASSVFYPSVRLGVSTLGPQPYNSDSNTLATVYFPGYQPYMATNSVSDDGRNVATITINYYARLAGIDKFYFYLRVAADSSTSAGGTFTLDYGLGTAPDGSYTEIPSALVGSANGTTKLNSLDAPYPAGTGYGYVDLGVLVPGELANPDLPALIRGTTTQTADMKVESNRIITWGSLSTVALSERRPDAATLSGAVGTGVSSAASPTRPETNGTDPEQSLSTLPTYYV